MFITALSGVFVGFGWVFQILGAVVLRLRGSESIAGDEACGFLQVVHDGHEAELRGVFEQSEESCFAAVAMVRRFVAAEDGLHPPPREADFLVARFILLADW